MSQKLPETDWPDEGTTMFPIVNFDDEDDSAVIPDSILWTLSDGAGNIMNSREDISIAVPAASIEIKLTGNDLLIVSIDKKRLLLAKAIYTSSRGAGQTLNRELEFEIIPIVKVP